MKNIKKAVIVLAVIFWTVFCSAVLAQAQSRKASPVCGASYRSGGTMVTPTLGQLKGSIKHGRQAVKFAGFSSESCEKLQEMRSKLYRDNNGFAVINPETGRPFTRAEYFAPSRTRSTYLGRND